MSDPVISVILTQVATILEQQIRRQIKLVSGVEKEINKLRSEFEAIKAVLIDAEKRQVKEERVKDWLEKIKDVAYETENVLSEWITAIRQSQTPPTTKVPSFIALPWVGYNKYALRHETAIKIENINKRLGEIATERVRYGFNTNADNEGIVKRKTQSYVDVSEVQGRELEEERLIGKLTSPRNQNSSLNVVSIIGLGGIGKTTLAQAAYHSSKVCQEFVVRVWVSVLEPFDVVRTANAILEDIEGSAPHFVELEHAARKIRRYIDGKKFLLILDDVCTEDFTKWEQLWNTLTVGAPGSTVLVTTRSGKVAKVMGSCRSNELQLEKLSDNDSWTLFKKIAFHDKISGDCKQLEGVGRQISDKCNGLPLTVKTIGSLMRFKNSLQEWKGVLDSEFWACEQAKGLFRPLMLSYYDLHPSMKRCFSFCAVFPKDHVIKADDLIKLWMAQGYLDSTEENAVMEDLGHEYLQTLAMLSFFEDMKTEEDGERIISVKMHGIVHDFAQYLIKNECAVLEANSGLELKIESSHKKVQHLTVIRSEDASFPKVPKMERLSTFWVQSFYDTPPIGRHHDKVEAEFFGHFPRLRALDLSHNRIGGLANEIMNLAQLKLLNLSHNPIQELPASLCELNHLQTLKLFACSRLRKLPQGIGKLVNLRHLEIDRTSSLKTLPKGIGKLESLQTLSKFIVSREKNAVGETTCEMEDLDRLNNLRGCMKIEGLEYVTSGVEAKRAKLKEKSYLLRIEMDFGTASQTGRQGEVIEALELHKNVQTLQISYYKGLKLPNWIKTLTYLQKLSLKDCTNCVDLPPLGRLPSLKTLHIEGMTAVKVIGLEFLGVRAGTMTEVDSLSEGNSTAFPMLKQLKISKMECWEEWNVTSNADTHFDVMPRLRCLKILHCTKLKALPVIILQKRSIGKLRVENCSPVLQEKYKEETGVELSKIPHIRKIRVG